MLSEHQIASLSARLARNLLGKHDRVRLEYRGVAEGSGYNELGLRMWLSNQLSSILRLSLTEEEQH